MKISPNAVPPSASSWTTANTVSSRPSGIRRQRKTSAIVEIKEVRMSPGIDVNDFNVKVRNAQRFLSDGNRVKVAVRFRGREMAHTDIGRRLLAEFASRRAARWRPMDKEPKLDGRHMTMFLSRKPEPKTRKSKI
ncbi:MAG: translation initiation factor IF-3 [Evtepia sp.]